MLSTSPLAEPEGRPVRGLTEGSLRTLSKYLASVGLLVGLSTELEIGVRDVPATVAVVASVPAVVSGLFDPRSHAPLFANMRGVVPPLSSDWASVAPPSAPSPEPVPTPEIVPSSRVASPSIPLPVPRPADLSGVFRPARPTIDRGSATAAAPPEEPSFFAKLFGSPSRPEANVTLASLDPRPVTVAPPAARTSPALPSQPGVAIYDISARSVTLPNGERLEAHSGLGDRLDDPRSVHIRMRGATPPGEYELKEREQLFHGVRALRLNPVGGAGAVFGRAGLLAHTFMLGPNGDSNGCVSFKDYEKFLNAYLRGEVTRLVVVAGNPTGGSSFFGLHLGTRDPLATRDRNT